MSSDPFDVVIVGAGAAGLMTGIVSGREGLKTVVLDGREKIGAKILISGGTRCNVTNQEVTEADFESESIHHVRNVLRAFSSRDAARFFGEIGVDLVLEEGGKYFPSTHSAQTVLTALIHGLKDSGAVLKTGQKVTRIAKTGGHFSVQAGDRSYTSKTVVLCTGGLSYPTTGSDGTGYALACETGHQMVPTSPSLTPLTTPDREWKNLTGLAVHCELLLETDGKKAAAFSGPLLFTHFGFSGPAALNISRHWIRSGGKRELYADFLPNEKTDAIKNWLVSAASKFPSKSLKKTAAEKLPERLADVLISKSGMRPDTRMNQFERKDREKFARDIKRAPLSVDGSIGYTKAEVTAGGIDLKEVDFRTMESKICPGLFFAGEILDVDGRIGGFNFQWAWSSGTVAARGVKKRVHGR